MPRQAGFVLVDSTSFLTRPTLIIATSRVSPGPSARARVMGGRGLHGTRQTSRVFARAWTSTGAGCTHASTVYKARAAGASRTPVHVAMVLLLLIKLLLVRRNQRPRLQSPSVAVCQSIWFTDMCNQQSLTIPKFWETFIPAAHVRPSWLQFAASLLSGDLSTVRITHASISLMCTQCQLQIR